MFLIQSRRILNTAGEKDFDFVSWEAPQHQRENRNDEWIYKIASRPPKLTSEKTAYRSTSPTILISVFSVKGV
jgi:hypothetical protein